MYILKFIVLSLLWAWRVDNFKPDRYDILGALVALMKRFLFLPLLALSVIGYGQTNPGIRNGALIKS
jgi:drug/metabolite transporter superfamily protein YnfA